MPLQGGLAHTKVKILRVTSPEVCELFVASIEHPRFEIITTDVEPWLLRRILGWNSGCETIVEIV